MEKYDVSFYQKIEFSFCKINTFFGSINIAVIFSQIIVSQEYTHKILDKNIKNYVSYEFLS